MDGRGVLAGEGRRLSLLSVVAPMHDEQATALAFYERVAAALDGLPWELVVVDDGSRDDTPGVLTTIADTDPRVKVLTLSRNFGHQAALTAGLRHAAGDVVVSIDADLQDPPEVILDLLPHWRAGADVVAAVRSERRGETRFKLWTARWFYRTFERLAQIDMPQEAGDFRLMDRRALGALLALPERNRFLRGMSCWIGYAQARVPYERDARYAGETKFTLARMVRFSLDAIVSFSQAPLQLATLLGFVFAALAFLAIPLTVVARYADIFVPGISSTLVVVLLLGGIQLISIGIIGEYIGRIYDEVKRRPMYLIRERRNVPPEFPLQPDERRQVAHR